MTNSALPPGARQETLEANLEALARVDRKLAERLCLPVSGDHVVFRGERPELLVHGQPYALSLAEADVERLLSEVPAGGPALVLGAGLGELVRPLLARAARVHVWERDPWLLRLMLATRDESAWLRSKRLVLHLGPDLLDAPRPDAVRELVHPLLGGVYRREIELWRAGPGARRALVCAGGLFVDELSSALARRGYSVYTLDVERLAVEELDLAARRFRPELVLSVDYTNGLVEFCARHGLAFVCWEVDPAASEPAPIEGPTSHARLYTYRKELVAAWRRAGLEHVEYLPLAADPESRAPVELTDAERERYAAPISFVGSSMVENAKRFAALFEQHFARWPGAARPGDAGGVGEGRSVLGDVLSAQRADPTTYRVPELLEARAPGFRAWLAESGAPHDAAALAAEIAAAEKRLTYCAGLGALGLRVWGDAGWKAIEKHGVRCMGPAGHRRELNRVYSGSLVNLDVGRIYQTDIATMRTFDVLACGGFALVEHNDALSGLFEIGLELETYRAPHELLERARFFTSHPDLARRVAERGRAAVLERHTIDLRLGHMLDAGAGAPAE